MKYNGYILAALLVFSNAAIAADGMVNVKSQHSVADTADRLVGILNNKGMKVFNRVPHSDGARNVGVELRDTHLIIFGNPKIGSKLMACQQSVAIDLPMKALVWQDANKQSWISYNSPDYLASRHGLSGCEGVLEKVKKALAGMTSAAAGQ
ncbi:MAG: DUF302 domain-containing protein [Pseudomonadota bacterium]